MGNLLGTVLMLAGGGLCAVGTVPTLLKKRGSVFESILVGLLPAGGACFFLGLGGLGIASMAHAAAAVTWLGVLTIAGPGLILLSVVGKLAQVIWRGVADSWK